MGRYRFVTLNNYSIFCDGFLVTIDIVGCYCCVLLFISFVTICYCLSYYYQFNTRFAIVFSYCPYSLYHGELYVYLQVEGYPMGVYIIPRHDCTKIVLYLTSTCTLVISFIEDYLFLYKSCCGCD